MKIRRGEARMANMRKTSSDTLKLRRLINSLKVRERELAEMSTFDELSNVRCPAVTSDLR